MNEEGISPEKTLLKRVFKPRGWDDYERRSEMLSSPDPGDWKSIDFPSEIALELTNYCNLRCVMCPVPRLRRKRGFMDKAIFEKVVADLTGGSGFLFLPQGFGESFLHAEWSGFIDFARSSQIGPIVVLTNGMLLLEAKIAALMSSVDIVVVTVDGSTAATYESVRLNARFEIVTRNIEDFLTVRGHSARPHLILRMIRMRDTEKEVEAFRSFWSGKIGKEDIIQVSDCIDWAGNVPYRGTQKTQIQERRHPCRMLWKNLTVYHDGRVSPCCYDAEGEMIIGDVLRQSMADIWNGPALQNLRNLHLSSQFHKIPICSRCSNWH